MYEGEEVPLDMPMVNENEKVLSENQLDRIEDWKFQDGWGFIEDYRREDEFGPNKKIAFLAYNSRRQKDLSKGQSLNVGLLDKLTPKIGQRLVNQLKADYLPSAMKITKDMIKQAGVDMVIVVDHNVSNNIIGVLKESLKENLMAKFQDALNDDQFAFFQRSLDKAKRGEELNQSEEQVVKYFGMVKAKYDDAIAQGMSPDEITLNPNKPIDEAKKKKKKDPPIGKPKRGGSKAYYVYVRDPKTKRIKKVSFGSGGLRAKIRNPKARKAFAARHRCSEKNDRTKASYWSCRLPRYAKQLGLGANMNTFW
jgi:hypothetical protein